MTATNQQVIIMRKERSQAGQAGGRGGQSGRVSANGGEVPALRQAAFGAEVGA